MFVVRCDGSCWATTSRSTLSPFIRATWAGGPQLENRNKCEEQASIPQVFEQRDNWDNGEYRAVNGLTIAKGGRCSEVTIMNVDPKSCAGTSARRSLAQHDQSVPTSENRLGAARFWVFASTYSSTSNNSMGGTCGGQRWNVILLQRQLRVSH